VQQVLPHARGARTRTGPPFRYCVTRLVDGTTAKSPGTY
jgi:hypothetical protein